MFACCATNPFVIRRGIWDGCIMCCDSISIIRQSAASSATDDNDDDDDDEMLSVMY